MTETVARTLRRMEVRLGIDRDGRSVWVWLLPLGSGLLCAVLAPFMPGIGGDMNLITRVLMGLFAFVTMTLISSLYLIQLSNEHNHEWTGEEPPSPHAAAPEPPPPGAGSRAGAVLLPPTPRPRGAVARPRREREPALSGDRR